MTVLVIEDEPLIRAMYSEFLELLGHEPDVTGNGREGLALRPGRPRDRGHGLPHAGIDGLRDCRGRTGAQPHDADRDDPRSAEPQDERRAAQAGLRFLRKPLAFAQFKATLAEVAEPASAAR